MNLESLISEGTSDDFGQICNIGLNLVPDCPGFNRGKGSKWLNIIIFELSSNYCPAKVMASGF